MGKATIIENKQKVWPELELGKWEDTYTLLHLLSQIVGKIKLQFAPYTNHWWNVAFALTANGLTTGIIPYGSRTFELEFDLIYQQLNILLDDGTREVIHLRSGSIADFYFELKGKLKASGIEINIWTVPVEVDDRLPFDKDFRQLDYDDEYANRYWECLLQVSKVLQLLRSGFTGKASPIHFFWGSFDLALTFFSGRPAPEHPGAPNVGRKVMVESYNSELASFGFWGGKGLGEAAFYSYNYPEPAQYRNFAIQPKEAFYNETFGEFILPYSVARKAAYPENVILNFYKSAFAATEELANWDRRLFRE
jgi:hypothetical protein